MKTTKNTQTTPTRELDMKDFEQKMLAAEASGVVDQIEVPAQKPAKKIFLQKSEGRDYSRWRILERELNNKKTMNRKGLQMMYLPYKKMLLEEDENFFDYNINLGIAVAYLGWVDGDVPYDATVVGKYAKLAKFLQDVATDDLGYVKAWLKSCNGGGVGTQNVGWHYPWYNDVADIQMSAHRLNNKAHALKLKTMEKHGAKLGRVRAVKLVLEAPTMPISKLATVAFAQGLKLQVFKERYLGVEPDGARVSRLILDYRVARDSLTKFLLDKRNAIANSEEFFQLSHYSGMVHNARRVSDNSFCKVVVTPLGSTELPKRGEDLGSYVWYDGYTIFQDGSFYIDAKTIEMDGGSKQWCSHSMPAEEGYHGFMGELSKIGVSFVQYKDRPFNFTRVLFNMTFDEFIRSSYDEEHGMLVLKGESSKKKGNIVVTSLVTSEGPSCLFEHTVSKDTYMYDGVCGRQAWRKAIEAFRKDCKSKR